MSLRPKLPSAPTREVPIVAPVSTPETRYRAAVNEAISCLDRCYRAGADALSVAPVPVADLGRWADLLNVLCRCSDALCKLK